jgi:hypothetical protein
MFRGMDMANSTEIVGTMDLAVAVSSTVMTSHSGVVNSIVIVEGLLRRSMRVSGGRCTGWFRRCDGWFGVFFFNERGWRWCVWSR